MSGRALSLYHFPGCPFCSRVEEAIQSLGVEIERLDVVRDPDRHEELVRATGRRTVPCLRIEKESGETQWLHESGDIIAYLEACFAA